MMCRRRRLFAAGPVPRAVLGALPDLPVAALVLLLAAGPAAAWQSALPGAANAGTLPWGYAGDQGPSGWGALAPEFVACGNGKRQSPVPISTETATFVSCEPLRFRYRSSALYLVNDGNALRLGYDRGSFVVISGLSYELVEVRFHVPAEHAIDGHLGDAEVQLIHINNRGDIAIVSAPLIAGRRSNQTLARILEHAPATPGESYYGRNVGINPLFLLPGRKDYFAYDGSLTRPPCTEGVHWYVLATPMEVGADEIEGLARVTGNNARPLQSLLDRPVQKNTCTP